MTKTKEDLLREKILSGSAKLFQQYGLEKTTIEDIAKAAGKGKSTLYYYFKSKEEIFEAILKEENQKFFSLLQQKVGEASTATDKLNVFCRARLDNLKAWTILYKVLVQEGIEALRTGNGGAVAKYRIQHDNKETSILKNILQYGIVTGEFRVFTESELDMLSFVCMSSMHGLEMDLVIHERLDEVLENFDLLQDMMMKGILK